MGFEVLDPKNALPFFKKIRRAEKREEKVFSGFDFFHEKVCAQKFQVLKNRFEQSAMIYFSSGEPRLLVNFFIEKMGRSGVGRYRLGYVYGAPSATDDDVHHFVDGVDRILRPFSEPVVGPLNGHMNLGFSLPDNIQTSRANHQVTFLTASESAMTRKVYSLLNFKTHRNYEAYVLPTWASKVEDFADHAKGGADISGGIYYARPLRLTKFKSEVRIYNHLVNECMKDHPLFEPLDFDEEWDLMGPMAGLIQKKYFQFLMYNKKEIGFCFGIPDYNMILKPGRSDLVNLGLALWGRRQVKRGRIIYSGLLPEYRGQKIFKIARHSVIRNMFEDGIEEIESGYIDESNQISRWNVLSTGGELNRRFRLFAQAAPTLVHKPGVHEKPGQEIKR